MMPTHQKITHGKWTPERDQVVRNDWPLGFSEEIILARVNKLPGPLILIGGLRNRASVLRVRRPEWFIANRLSEQGKAFYQRQRDEEAARIANKRAEECRAEPVGVTATRSASRVVVKPYQPPKPPIWQTPKKKEPFTMIGQRLR